MYVAVLAAVLVSRCEENKPKMVQFVMFLSVVSVGEERYLGKIRTLILFQAKMCIFPTSIADLTEVLRD